MGVFLGLPRKLVAGKDKNMGKITRIVSELKKEPALWIWYIYDEPKNAFTTDLTMVYQKIKELDPFHPVAVVHGKLENLRYCVSFSDLLWTDRYDLPFTFLPVMRLAKNIRNSLSKPSWIVSQAHAVNYTHLAREWQFERKDGAQSLYFPPHTHRPNPKEIRAQYHHALSLNSPGVLFYWYPDDYYNLREDVPEVWQALSDLGAEASELTDVLTSEDPVPEIQMYFNGSRKKYDDLSVQRVDTDSTLIIDITTASWRKNEVSPGFNIRYWIRMYENRLYIGLVNASYDPLFLVTLSLPFRYKKVYQLPGSRLIIDRTNPRNFVSNLAQGDVIIRNNSVIPDSRGKASTQTLSFILDECSTAVWCFEPE
jgi:hypothetical protein